MDLQRVAAEKAAAVLVLCNKFSSDPCKTLSLRSSSSFEHHQSFLPLISNGWESLVFKAHNEFKLKAKFLTKVKTNVLPGMPRQRWTSYKGFRSERKDSRQIWREQKSEEFRRILKATVHPSHMWSECPWIGGGLIWSPSMEPINWLLWSLWSQLVAIQGYILMCGSLGLAVYDSGGSQREPIPQTYDLCAF